MMSTEMRARITAGVVWGAGAVLGVYALKALRIITLPLTFAFIVVLLVYPVQRRVNALMSPRLIWPGVIAALSTYLVVIALLAGMIKGSGGTVVQNLRWYVERLPGYAESLFAWARAHHIPMQASPVQESRLLTEIMSVAGSWLSRSGSVATEFVLVFFLVLLMLLEADEWPAKLTAIFGEPFALKACGVVSAVSRNIRLLLLIRTVVSLLIGISGGIWLWLMGVDYPLSWGVLIYLFNYIPYIGSVAIMLPPTVLVAIKHGPARGGLVFLGLTVIHMVIGNYVEPRWEGRALTISPIVIFLAVIFWGWLWGVWGAFLSIPLMIVVIMVCAHIPPLKPLATLLSSLPQPRKPR